MHSVLVSVFQMQAKVVTIFMRDVSLQDIVCGLLLSMILTPIFFQFIDTIDRFQLTHPYSPIVMIAVPLLLSICYPTLDKWSTARGDTVLILGAISGFAIGARMAYSQGLHSQPSVPPPYFVKLPDAEFVLTTIVRMSLGGTILVASRSVSKFVLLRSLCYMYGIAHDDPKSRQMLKVELPYKFVTYFIVGVSIIYTAPYIFNKVGVSRVTNFTDL